MVKTPTDLIPLSEAARTLGVVPRTLRHRVGKLPACAKRKVGREWHLDPCYLPELLSARARRHVQPDDDKTLWRPADSARDATVRRVVEDADTFAASRASALTESDAVFSQRYGGGARYGVAFKASTLRRWRRKLHRGGSFAERRGRRRGGTSDRIGSSAWEFFVATHLKTRVPLAQAHEITSAKSAEHADDPAWKWSASLSTVRKRFKAEQTPFYRDYYLEGPDKWRAKHLPKIDRRQHELPANHTWECDGTKANVLCRDGDKTVRPAVIMVLCPASRMVVGVAVGHSESTELIRRAFRDAYQSVGAPKLVRVDRGKAFLGEGIGDRNRRKRDDDREIVVGLIRVMQAEPHFCTGRSGWEKGTVEALMRSIDQGHDRLYEKAYVGNNTKNRRREADQYARRHHDRLPTIAEYEQSLGEFWEAENRRPRKDLDGLSPWQKFQRTAIPERRLPKQAEEFIRRRPQRVTVTNRGVVIKIAGETVHYGHCDPRVWELQGQKLIAYIDESDLSNVILCERDGRPLFRAQNDGLFGTDAETYREAGKLKKKAAKLRREHFANIDLAAAPTVDVALKLKRKAADMLAAKNETTETPERGRLILHVPRVEALEEAQRESVRVAVGDGTGPPSESSIIDVMKRCAPDARTDGPGLKLEDIDFGEGQG